MKNKRLSKGIFFVFEGIDGSGKSTQARYLYDHLIESGIKVCLTQEPSDSIWGKKIREHACKPSCSISPVDELDLFIRDREEHVKNVISPLLDKCFVVISDRYYFSTLAYQGAKLTFDDDTLKKVTYGMPVPDMVFYLNISPEDGIARIGRDRGYFTKFEKLDYLKRVCSNFDSFNGPNIFSINGALSKNDIAEKIVCLTEDLINKFVSGTA